jgi:hypothetical protein
MHFGNFKVIPLAQREINYAQMAKHDHIIHCFDSCNERKVKTLANKFSYVWNINLVICSNDLFFHKWKLPLNIALTTPLYKLVVHVLHMPLMN